MSIGRWADAAGHPSGASLVAAGYVGVLVYGGTPGRAKNITKAVYDDYRAHGLLIASVFEDGVNDIASGQGTGHAHALMADLLTLDPDAAATIAIAAAADKHLTAADIPVGVGYQRDFYAAAKASAWHAPVGGYGFSEYTRAIWAAGVAEWLWQAGSESALWPGVTFWQRNDGPDDVGGVQVDPNEQYLPIGPAAPLVAGTSQEDLSMDIPAGPNVRRAIPCDGKQHVCFQAGFGAAINGHMWFIGDTKPGAGPQYLAGSGNAFHIDSDKPGPITVPDNCRAVQIEATCSVPFTAWCAAS
jgi:hypothetical protein